MSTIEQPKKLKSINFDAFLQERVPGASEAVRNERWRKCVSATLMAAGRDQKSGDRLFAWPPTEAQVDNTIAEQRLYGFNPHAAFYWANWCDHLEKITTEAQAQAAEAESKRLDISAKRRAAGANGNASQKRNKDGTKDKRRGARARREERLTPILRAVAGLDTI